MIEPSESPVDVDELMARLRAKVAQLRRLPESELSASALSVRSNVFINSIEASTNVADAKSQIRTHWPSHIGSTFPFNVTSIREFTLRLLAFLFKDQRHVNVAVVSVLREQISLNRHLMEQLEALRREVENLITDAAARGVN